MRLLFEECVVVSQTREYLVVIFTLTKAGYWQWFIWTVVSCTTLVGVRYSVTKWWCTVTTWLAEYRRCQTILNSRRKLFKNSSLSSCSLCDVLSILTNFGQTLAFIKHNKNFITVNCPSLGCGITTMLTCVSASSCMLMRKCIIW